MPSSRPPTPSLDRFAPLVPGLPPLKGLPPSALRPVPPGQWPVPSGLRPVPSGLRLVASGLWPVPSALRPGSYALRPVPLIPGSEQRTSRPQRSPRGDPHMQTGPSLRGHLLNFHEKSTTSYSGDMLRQMGPSEQVPPCRWYVGCVVWVFTKYSTSRGSAPPSDGDPHTPRVYPAHSSAGRLR